MITKQVNRIHRSRLIELSFTRIDALDNKADRAMRQANLEKAMKKGITHRSPVSLQFQLSDGSVGETQATVWGLEGDKVELKGGKVIPVSAIVSVGL